MSMDNTKSQFVGATDSYNLFFNSCTHTFSHSTPPVHISGLILMQLSI